MCLIIQRKGYRFAYLFQQLIRERYQLSFAHFQFILNLSTFQYLYLVALRKLILPPMIKYSKANKKYHFFFFFYFSNAYACFFFYYSYSILSCQSFLYKYSAQKSLYCRFNFLTTYFSVVILYQIDFLIYTQSLCMTQIFYEQVNMQLSRTINPPQNPKVSPITQDKPLYIVYLLIIYYTKTYKKTENNNIKSHPFTNCFNNKQENQQQSSKDKINKFLEMIELYKIDLLITPKLFNESTKKYIRIQPQPTKVVRTMNFAKPVSQTNIQWDEVIQLPYITDKQIPFQIYEKHEFGYNPEQLSSVMHGKMKFDERYAKFYNWQVLDSSDRKLGYLSVNVKSKPRGDMVNSQLVVANQQPKMNNKKLIDDTELVIISSIVAHLPELKSKRAYALLTVGTQHLRTSPVKSKSGELIFIQKYQLQKPSTIQQVMMIDIFSCGQDEADVKVASCRVKLEKRIERKLRFYLPDDERKEVGEGFVDGKVQLKAEIVTDRIFAGIIKRGIQNQFLNTHHRNNTTTFKPLSRSIVLTHKSNTLAVDDGQSYSPMTRAKRFSIVNKNSDIKIPQQKRFFTSRDPVNKNCSYLPQQSFEFKVKKVDRYYRGASIGYGDKVDFTHPKKSIPSVGKYQLPSIWDRY